MSSPWLQIIQELTSQPPPASTGVERDVLRHKQISLSGDVVLTVQGVRRCGKSTLLRQIAHKAGIADKACFINFEDPRLGDHLDYRLLDAIVSVNENISPNRHFYFFDEIQHVKGWEKWLHVQLESGSRHFVVTGSNSQLLSGRYATALTGRHRTLELFPFSFAEFRRLQPKQTFDDYLRRGGFPRVLVDDDGPALLREYFRDIVERDVRLHVAARTASSLIQLGKALAEAVGSETSWRRLAAAFDTSVDTIKRHIEAFEYSYMFMPCPFWATSERKRAHKPKKYYCIDTGLRRSVITLGGEDLGKSFEQYVFGLLRRKYHRVFHWKNQHEMDFVVETEHGILPIQVNYLGAAPKHSDAATEFYRAHPRSLPMRIITRRDAETLATEFAP